MTNLQDITQAYLQSILHYDPETGIWRWLWRDGIHISVNVRDTGRIAGTISDQGYRLININGRPRRAHRLAFIYMEGKEPSHDVDHRYLDRSDCRWDSIRSATRAQNLWNAQRRVDNTSGYKGIDWMKKQRMWRARIGGKHLGIFFKLEDAIACRRAAAEELHGEFVRHA